MLRTLELAYLGIEVPEPASLDAVFGEIAGLTPGAIGDSVRTWRNDDRVHRVIVSQGPANDAVVIGIEARDSAAFDATVARLSAAGFAPVQGSEQVRAARQVERLVHLAAPWGIELELVLGLERAAEPFASERMTGGFLTEGVGFGHVAIATSAYEDTRRLLVEGLGFAQTDWIDLPMGPDLTIEVAFFHCNPRHHTFAVVGAPFEMPQRLHHVMFETNDRNDVGYAFDRAWASGLAIPNGLGMHDNDRMFSFYVASPAGFAVEVGHGARTITEDWNDNRRYDSISIWGHQPLRGLTES